MAFQSASHPAPTHENAHVKVSTARDSIPSPLGIMMESEGATRLSMESMPLERHACSHMRHDPYLCL